MDLNNFFDYLVPILFIIFWVITNIAKSKKRDQERERQNEERQARGEKRTPSPLEEIFGMEVEEEEEEEPQVLMEEEEVEPVVVKPVEKVKTRDYILELREQERRVQETRKQVESIKKGRQKMIDQPLLVSETKKLRPFAMDVVKMIKGGHSMKKAVLGYEILGTPMALRQDGEIKKSWD